MFSADFIMPSFRLVLNALSDHPSIIWLFLHNVYLSAGLRKHTDPFQSCSVVDSERTLSLIGTAQLSYSQNNGAYVCEYCTKRFDVKCNYEGHIFSQHLACKPYKCDKCDKAFAYKRSLNYHLRANHNFC